MPLVSGFRIKIVPCQPLVAHFTGGHGESRPSFSARLLFLPAVAVSCEKLPRLLVVLYHPGPLNAGYPRFWCGRHRMVKYRPVRFSLPGFIFRQPFFFREKWLGHDNSEAKYWSWLKFRPTTTFLVTASSTRGIYVYQQGLISAGRLRQDTQTQVRCALLCSENLGERDEFSRRSIYLPIACGTHLHDGDDDYDHHGDGQEEGS